MEKGSLKIDDCMGLALSDFMPPDAGKKGEIMNQYAKKIMKFREE